jgi:hypothetical protein
MPMVFTDNERARTPGPRRRRGGLPLRVAGFAGGAGSIAAVAVARHPEGVSTCPGSVSGRSLPMTGVVMTPPSSRRGNQTSLSPN